MDSKPTCICGKIHEDEPVCHCGELMKNHDSFTHPGFEAKEMETQPPVPDAISYKGNETQPWWWKYISTYPIGEGPDLSCLEYIDIEEALPKLIAEAENRLLRELREEVESLEESYSSRIDEYEDGKANAYHDVITLLNSKLNSPDEV